jgi:hypothetical protein
MTKNYKKDAADARERSATARKSSNQHARDLDGMRKVADEAAGSLEERKAYRRKRNQAAGKDRARAAAKRT